MSFADYERDAVLIHVSASNERQEWGNETGLKRREEKEKDEKKTEENRTPNIKLSAV